MDLDELLQIKKDQENNNRASSDYIEETTPETFISVWPDELPLNDPNPYRSDRGRPIYHFIELPDGSTTVEWDYSCMYLYDFPDPEQLFHLFGHSFVLDKIVLHFYYDKNITNEGGIQEKVDISPEEFDSLIDLLIDAGYTDNSKRTDSSYYCEKYGVGIWVVITNEFPWVEDEPRLVYKTNVNVVFIRLQLIDPDYKMDLEAIKAEEYRRWIESH